MVVLNRIYTRTGDDGFTGLVDGARISKTAPRVCAYGDVDELNAQLGVCRTVASQQPQRPHANSACQRAGGGFWARQLFGWRKRPCQPPPPSPLVAQLSTIQNELFDIGSELATPPGGGWEGMPRTTPEQVARLEQWIDQLNESLSPLRSFVLPGGTILNAHLHVARTVCRRAERTVLALKHHEEVSPAILHYLNRLSDLLFVMSRYASAEAGCAEYLWVPGGSPPQINHK
jgi:cob(I)alamin adenosyltransferase